MKRTWLVEIRKEKDYKQNQLAQEVGIAKSYLSEIEQGRRTPSGYLALRIARVLGFRMEKFYETEEEAVS